MLDMARVAPLTRLDNEGIWTTGQGVEVSYPEHGHSACLAVEDTSFWFRHRNRCIVAAVRRHLRQETGPIFDIGSGNGFVSLALEQAGYEVVAVEPGLQGARNARRRGVRNVICGTTHTSGLAPRSLSAAGVFDVVEHMDDDHGFVRHLHDLLRPGAPLFVTVPAYSGLWSDEDVRAGHHRRYTRDSITKVLQANGFALSFASYFFRPLPVAILLMRSLPFRLGLRRGPAPAGQVTREHAAGLPRLTKLVESALTPEVSAIESGREMSFGASLLVVAQASGRSTS